MLRLLACCALRSAVAYAVLPSRGFIAVQRRPLPAAPLSGLRVAGAIPQMEQTDGPQTPFVESDDARAVKLTKAIKAMTSFANKYCENTGTTYCDDLSIPAVVIKGLAEHKVTLGTPLCPCRHYEDKEAEAKDGYWNCPCVPMRERHDCHCMLFLTADNEFAGKGQAITVDEVEATNPYL